MDKTTKTTIAFLILMVLLVAMGIVFSMLQRTDIIEPIKVIRSKKLGISTIAHDEYVTNLEDNTVVKVKLRFEGDETAEKELDRLWPIVRYHCLAVLRGMDREDFNRPEEIERFKQKVLERINNELINGKIDEVYITELILY